LKVQLASWLPVLKWEKRDGLNVELFIQIEAELKELGNEKSVFGREYQGFC
jgi:hypothetical protein